MKLALILSLALVVWISASAADRESEDLTRATVVQAWDQRVSDLHSTPVVITDSNSIAALRDAIQNAPGKWEAGSFTAPSGYIRFIFRRDSQVLAAIGLGDGFLVQGSGGHWESKKITKELEAKIAVFGQPKSPNNSLQTTADGAFNLTIESLVFKCRSSEVFEVGR